MRIYLAHQISGLSYDEVVDYYENTASSLRSLGYTVFNPMTGKSCLRTEREFKSHGYNDKPVSTNQAIKERDQWMVLNSDIVFVNFDGTEYASIGMTMELAWADLMNKHTIVVIPKENVHNHAFILECADIVFYNYNDAMDYLTKLIDGRV